MLLHIFSHLCDMTAPSQKLGWSQYKMPYLCTAQNDKTLHIGDTLQLHGTKRYGRRAVRLKHF